MALRNVNTPDNTPGAGQAPMLARPSRSVESETSLVQIVDQWDDAEDRVAYQAVGSVTLPVLSTTIGFRPVLPIIVPTNKLFIPKALFILGAGTQQCVARIVRRFHFWAFSGATIAAPVAPTLAVNAGTNTGFPAGQISYKLTALNNVGETTASPASATVTPTANDSVSLTLTAVTGARRWRIYRTLAGAPGGPWFLLHELDAGQTGYRDVHPESDLNQSVQPPGANGTAGSVQGEIAPQPCAEVQAIVQDVALAASPSRMVYKDEDGLQEDVATTVALTVNTQTRLPLKRQDISLTGTFDSQARTKVTPVPRGEINNGATQVVTMIGNPATGQYNIYGLLPLLPTEMNSNVAPVAGMNSQSCRFAGDVAFPPGAEVIIELAHSHALATPAAAVREVLLIGRMIPIT